MKNASARYMADCELTTGYHKKGYFWKWLALSPIECRRNRGVLPSSSLRTKYG